jgi:hypothetical protein
MFLMQYCILNRDGVQRYAEDEHCVEIPLHKPTSSYRMCPLAQLGHPERRSRRRQEVESDGFTCLPLKGFTQKHYPDKHSLKSLFRDANPGHPEP